MKRPPLCAHRLCGRVGRQGIGWGFGTGVTQFWCDEHYPGALVRLAGLVRFAVVRLREHVAANGRVA